MAVDLPPDSRPVDRARQRRLLWGSATAAAAALLLYALFGVVFIFPKFLAIWEDLGVVSLPLPTRVLAALHCFVLAKWWLCVPLAGGVVGVAIWRKWWATPWCAIAIFVIALLLIASMHLSALAPLAQLTEGAGSM